MSAIFAKIIAAIRRSLFFVVAISAVIFSVIMAYGINLSVFYKDVFYQVRSYSVNVSSASNWMQTPGWPIRRFDMKDEAKYTISIVHNGSGKYFATANVGTPARTVTKECTPGEACTLIIDVESTKFEEGLHLRLADSSRSISMRIFLKKVEEHSFMIFDLLN